MGDDFYCIYGEEHYYGEVTCEHPEFYGFRCVDEECPLKKEKEGVQ